MNRLGTRAILLALAACLGGCAAPMPPLGGTSLTLEALKNADYASAFPVHGRAVMVNGVYREGRGAASSSDLTVALDGSFYAFGDLDGDGARDAAVILVADPGGSGTFLDLAAVLNRGGSPLHAASLRLGDRVRVQSLTVEGRVVGIVLDRHGPDDPRCCPTMTVGERYVLRGGSLVPAP